MSDKTKIFISYGRKDGREFAGMLRDLLQSDEHAYKYELWQDVVSMEGGDEPWWNQIKTAIEKCDVVIMVFTEAALQSKVVLDEWNYARSIGTHLMPITPDPDIFRKAPNWISRVPHFVWDVDDPDFRLTQDRFFRDLDHPPARQPKPFTAPRFEADKFIPRPELSEPIIAALLDEGQNAPIAITTALEGGGGFGKTTLALALCHDDRVRNVYDDGILWVQLRESSDDNEVTALLNAQIRWLKPDEKPFQYADDAAVRLGEILADKRVLLVLDDVWNRNYPNFFTRCTTATYLITTRLHEVVRGADADAIDVDELTPDQAYDLFMRGIPLPDPIPQQQAAIIHDLLHKFDGWALMIELANGRLAENVELYGFEEGLQTLHDDFEALGFTAFDRDDPTARNDALQKSINVSLLRLEADQQTAFRQMGIFPDDTDVPLSALEGLWEQKGPHARRWVERFFKLSLLKYDPAAKTIRLHDAVRGCIAEQLTDQPALHAKLLAAWGDPRGLDTEYACRYYAYHLGGAGRLADLKPLLTDFAFILNKLKHTDPAAFVEDGELLLKDEAFKADPIVKLMRSFWNVSAHVLGDPEDHDQLHNQIIGRLGGYTALYPALKHDAQHPEIEALVLAARDYAENHDDPMLILTQPALNAAGGYLQRIMKHTSVVEGAIQLADGDILSWSQDRTLRRWAADGTPRHTLSGHTHRISGAIQLADGDILSWSQDTTLRRWAADGAPRGTLSGHTDAVNGAIQLADGDILSWSQDTTLRRWTADGAPRHTLSGHTDRVRGAIQLADGDILSWSDDYTLRRWTADGAPRHTLSGHTGPVWGAIQLADGDILSWELLGGYRLWGADGTAFGAVDDAEGEKLCHLAQPDGPQAQLGVDLKRNGDRVWLVRLGEDALLCQFVGDSNPNETHLFSDGTVAALGAGASYFLRPNAALRRIMGIQDGDSS